MVYKSASYLALQEVRVVRVDLILHEVLQDQEVQVAQGDHRVQVVLEIQLDQILQRVQPLQLVQKDQGVRRVQGLPRVLQIQ